MLEQEYKRIINFLNNQKVDYLVIGGIAVSVLGNPRETNDIDLCIFIKKKDIDSFLKKLEKNGYIMDRGAMLIRAKETGTFNVTGRGIHIDFIIASHELEKNALKRKMEIMLHNVKAYYPSPEDLILLKVVPGRLRDLSDSEVVAKRYSGRLDREYLEGWAKKLSDEAEDYRIYKEIKRLLKL